jgi:hypothetical protein
MVHGDQKGEASISAMWQPIETALNASYARLEPDEDDLAVADEFPIPTDETKLISWGLAIRIVSAAYKRDPGRTSVPRFGAGGGGGIALHWRNNDAELLVSIPADRRKRVTFYGETWAGSSFEGAFDASDSVDPLAQWLIDHEQRPTK